MARIGALISVGMLLFPTLFQQAVQTRLDPLVDTTQGAAVIPRLKQYSRPVAPSSYSNDYIYIEMSYRVCQYVLFHILTMANQTRQQQLHHKYDRLEHRRQHSEPI